MIQCMQTQTKVMTDKYSCPNCYYVDFDMDAYPCSRCIRNMPVDDKFRPKQTDISDIKEDVRWP